MEILPRNCRELIQFRNEIESRSGRKTKIVVDHANGVYNIYSLREDKPHSIMAVVGFKDIKTGMIYVPKSQFEHGMAQGSLFIDPLATLTSGGRVNYLNVNPTRPRQHINELLDGQVS